MTEKSTVDHEAVQCAGQPVISTEPAYAMKLLPSSTIRLITSSQVISSIYSVIKEVIENSLDANATSIDIKLENYGLDKIEIRDNGSGVKEQDVAFMCRPHYTSKISDTDDLGNLHSYGFRGEALGSLCAVADVAVTTKTRDDPVSKTYLMDQKGCISTSVPSHVGQGTTILAASLFKNLPVRKQFYSTIKKKKDELKKIEDLVMSYGIIRHDVRFCLKHNRETIWQKGAMANSRSVLLNVLGTAVLNQLQPLTKTCLDPNVKMEAFLPKNSSSSEHTSRSTNDRCFIFVNKRPVMLKNVEKLLRKYFNASCGHSKHRWPVLFIHLLFQPGDLDVNVDPNKSRVMLHNQAEFLNFLRTVLDEIYDSPFSEKEEPTKNCVNRVNTPVLSEESNLSDTVIPSDMDNINVHRNKEPPSSTTEHIVFENIAPDTPERNPVEADSLTLVETLDTETSSAVCDPCPELLNRVDATSPASYLSSTQNEPPTSAMNIKPHIITPSRFDVSQIDKVAAPTQSIHFELMDDTDDDIFEGTNNQSSAEGMMDTTENPELSLHPRDLEVDVNRNVTEADDNVPGQLISEAAINSAGPASDWSKGTTLGSKENPMQPVKLCLPQPQQTTGSNKHDFSFNTSNTTLSTSTNQPSMLDYIANAPGDRPSVGFIYFSKEIRPQVLAKDPDASLQEVAKIIREKWKALSLHKRNEYEEVSKKEHLWETERTRIKEKSMVKMVQQAQKRRKIEQDDRRNSIEKLLSRSQEPKEKIKTQMAELKLSGLKQKIHRKPENNQSNISEDFQLIGPIKSHNVWIGKKDNDLTIFHPTRAQEVLIYHQLLSSHIVSFETTEAPVSITEMSLGDANLWSVLQSMRKNSPQPTDPFNYFIDNRLLHNGFKIRQSKSPDADDVRCEMVGIARCISFYGIYDLKELLEMVSNDVNISLSDSRPAKVKQYLQAEAVRMVRNRPSTVTEFEVTNLLSEMKETIPKNTAVCFHNKPFMYRLFDLDDVPQTEDRAGSQEK